MELDSNEVKQNYAKENHIYFCITVSNDNSLSHFNTHLEFPTYSSNFYYKSKLSLQKICFSFLTDPDPPDKIYLRNSVFLI
ncbi:MAG: hypothetical protein ACR2FN_11830 [Chitinophagaceae bacterium]